MILKKILSGFLLTDYFLWFLAGGLSCFFLILKFESPSGNFILDYQTFISSMILAGIASITVLVMRHQYKDSVYRKRLSMTAKMPDAIVQLTDYAQQCLYYIRDEGGMFPDPCAESVKIFQDSIEFLDTQSAEAIYELVSFYQIHNSRLKDYAHDGRDLQYNQRVFDVVKLNHLALRVFEYARNEQEIIENTEPTKDEMLRSLSSLIGFHRIFEPEEKHVELIKIISERFPPRS